MGNLPTANVKQCHRDVVHQYRSLQETTPFTTNHTARHSAQCPSIKRSLGDALQKAENLCQGDRHLRAWRKKLEGSVCHRAPKAAPWYDDVPPEPQMSLTPLALYRWWQDATTTTVTAIVVDGVEEDVKPPTAVPSPLTSLDLRFQSTGTWQRALQHGQWPGDVWRWFAAAGQSTLESVWLSVAVPGVGLREFLPLPSLPALQTVHVTFLHRAVELSDADVDMFVRALVLAGSEELRAVHIDVSRCHRSQIMVPSNYVFTTRDLTRSQNTAPPKPGYTIRDLPRHVQVTVKRDTGYVVPMATSLRTPTVD